MHSNTEEGQWEIMEHRVEDCNIKTNEDRNQMSLNPCISRELQKLGSVIYNI